MRGSNILMFDIKYQMFLNFAFLELSPMDGISAGTQKDEMVLRIVVRMPPQHIIKGVSTITRRERSLFGTICLICNVFGGGDITLMR